jgi:hypothetical protein
MNDESGKLVNVNVDLGTVGELSKPIHALVNRLSEHLGSFFEPGRVVKRAKAQAEVKLIEARTKIQLTEIEERGLRRLAVEEGSKQNNIETISLKALPHLKEDAKPEQLETDWITNFFDKAKLVSNAEMQDLWAKLLAQESNTPNSVSKKAMTILSSLDVSDAQLFTRFCACVWHMGDLVPLVFPDATKTKYTGNLTFNELKHLDSIGLVSFETVAGYIRKNFPSESSVFYYGRCLKIELATGSSDLPLGNVLLTSVGQQLAIVCGSQPLQDYYTAVVQKYFDLGHVLSSVAQNKSF